MGSKDKSDETKRIKSSELNKKAKKIRKVSTGKTASGKKQKFKVRHPRAATIIRISILVFILLCIIGKVLFF